MNILPRPGLRQQLQGQSRPVGLALVGLSVMVASVVTNSAFLLLLGLGAAVGSLLWSLHTGRDAGRHARSWDDDAAVRAASRRTTFHRARLVRVRVDAGFLVLELDHQGSTTELVATTGTVLSTLEHPAAQSSLRYRSLDAVLDSGEYTVLKRFLATSRTLEVVVTSAPTRLEHVLVNPLLEHAPA